MRSQAVAVDDLFPTNKIPKHRDVANLGLLQQINQRQLSARPANDGLAARIESDDLAARMQMTVPKVTDLQHESQITREQYRLEDENAANFGRGYLLARRLLEKGIHFVSFIAGRIRIATYQLGCPRSYATQPWT